MPSIARPAPLFADLGALVTADVRAPIAALAPEAGRLRGLLDEAGVVLFRSFELDVDLLARFAEAFLAKSLVYGGARVRVSEDDRVQLAENGQQAIGLHAEMAYTPVRPDLCFFACERPAASGGETTVGDGAAILDALSPETRRTFEAKRVKYVRTYAAAHWQRMFGVTDFAEVDRALRTLPGFEYAVGPNSELFTSYVTDAITTRAGVRWRAFANSVNNIAGFGNPRGFYSVYGDDSDIAEETRAELDRAHRAATRPIPWQAGDVVMIDNWRVLHGRNGFDDPGRRILAMFGYTGP